MTLFVYLVLNFIFILIAARSWVLKKKKSTPILENFFISFLILAIAQALANMLIIVNYFSPESNYLYLADILGRSFIVLSSAFIVRIPVYLFWPKIKKLNLITYVISIYAFLLLMIGFYLDYKPYIGANGIIFWEVPSVLAILLSVVFVPAWFFTAIVFFREFVIHKYKDKKSLFLGLSFTVITIGGLIQDLAISTSGYLLINMVFILGSLLTLVSLFAFRDE